MLRLTRAEQSYFFESILDKKAYNLAVERAIDTTIKKEDPFENIDFEGIWKIKGNKLLKKRHVNNK